MLRRLMPLLCRLEEAAAAVAQTSPPESPVVAALAPAQLSAGVAVASALAEALFAAVSCHPPPAVQTTHQAVAATRPMAAEAPS